MTTSRSPIVILTALQVEYNAVRAHLEKLRRHKHPLSGTIYEQGLFTVGNELFKVVIGQVGTGNAAAAAETQRAIDHFKPEYILFVGVAGGLKNVRRDDVLVANKVYQYESGKAKKVFETRPETFSPSYPLVQQAAAEAKRDLWRKRIRKSVPTSSEPPAVFLGAIAAGEKVVASKRSAVYQFVKQNYGDSLGVEMEGYGFLKAVSTNVSVKAIIIRGISDLISGKRAADDIVHQNIASQNASAFAFEV